MKRDKLVPCLCAAKSPHVDEDDTTGATFIECRKCHRVCGGRPRSDAVGMWNRAMTLPDMKPTEAAE